MPQTITVQVRGLAELERKLQDLPVKLAKKHLRDALRAGGNVFKRQMQANLQGHRLSGELASGITVKTGAGVGGGLLGKASLGPFTIAAVTGKDTSQGTASAQIGPARRKGGWRAHFLEFGTRGHFIRPKNKKVLARGGKIFGKIAVHPGARKHPFIAPAFDAKKEEATRVIAERLRRGLEQEARGK